MTDSTNPYTAPVSSESGEYDHSLFWTLVKILWSFILVAMVIDAIVLGSYGILHSTMNTGWEIIIHNINDDLNRLL